MKKALFIIFLLTTSLFLTSCNKDMVVVNNNNVSSSINKESLLNAKDIIEGKKTYELKDNNFVITADGSISKSGLTYVFAYFGTDYNNPVNVSGAPRYKFGETLLDTYELTLSTISPITPDFINPYYVLKRDYSFKAFRIDNNVKRELKNQETRPQSFYTSLDKDTIIPDVTFDGFNYFNYFLDDQFTSPLFTFGDLYKVNKDVSNTVYGVSRSDNSVLKDSSFDVDYVLSDFGIENVKDYYLTRDKKYFLNLVSSLEDFKYVTSKNYIALYSSKFNSLYVLLDKYIELKEDGRVISIVPSNVENIYITAPYNKVLFSDNSSFKGLFKNSTTKTIDITNNSPNNLSNVSHMFSGASNLESVIGLNTIDTAYSKSFSYMFYKTNKLNSVDLSSLNTSSAKDMAHMFDSTGLNNIDISNFNTMFVEDMKYMFNNTRSDSFDISHFNTGNAIDLRYMLSNIDQIDVVKFNSDLRSAKYFDGFLKNTSVIDLEIPYLKNADITFKDFLSDATVLNLNLEHSNFKSVLNFFSTILTSNVVISKSINLSHMFFKEQADTNSFFHNLFDKFKDVDIKYSNFMVSEYDYDLSGLLTDLDLSKLNFKYLDSWDVSKAAVFNNFFLNSYFPTLSKTNIISLPYWDMSSCISMDYFLYYSDVTELELATISKKGGTVTSFNNFFSTSSKIKKVDLSYFNFLPTDTTNIYRDDISLSNLQYFKINSIDLTSLDNILSSFKTYNTRDSLISLEVNNLDGSKYIDNNLNNMFSDFVNVRKLVLRNLQNTPIYIFNKTFSNFGTNVADEDVSYDLSNWTFTKYDTIVNPFHLISMFEGTNVSMFNLSNWSLADPESDTTYLDLTKTFYNSKSYHKTKAPTFNLSDIRPASGEFLVTEGCSVLSFGNLNNEESFTPDIVNLIRNNVELDFTYLNFTKISDYESGFSPTFYAYFGKLIFNNKNSATLSNIIYGLYYSSKLETLNYAEFNNLTFNDNHLYNFYFNLLSLPSKSIANKDNISYRNWSFIDYADNANLIFYKAPFIKDDVSTWNLEQVSNFDGFFLGSTIDSYFSLTFGDHENFNFHNFLCDTTIKVMPNFYFKSLETSGVESVSEFATYARSYVSLDFRNFPVKNNIKFSVMSAFLCVSFDDSVLERDRVIDISWLSKEKPTWDFINAKDLDTRLFMRNKTNNNAVTIKYEHADVFSFKQIRDLIGFVSTNNPDYTPYPLKELSLKHLNLRSTASNSSGSQYYLLDSLSEDLNVYLDYLDLEIGGSLYNILCNFNESTRSSLLRGNPSVTDFSTWNFRPVDMHAAFSRIGKSTVKYNLDLSNIEVSSVTNFDYIFDRSYIDTLNTSNWQVLTRTVFGWFELIYALNTWIFREMFINLFTTFYNTWGGSKVYTGTVPDGFPKP